MPISALALIPESDKKRVKRANEAFYTLEKATEHRDYHYLLNDEDLTDIARIEYNNFERLSSPDRGYHFTIVDNIQHLRQEINSLRIMVDSIAKSRLTLLINLGNLHWVTLVLSHQERGYNGYYVDSQGYPLEEQHRQLLESLNVRLNIIDISHQIRQPQDNYNAGILALENAHDLNQMLDQQQTVSWVLTALNRDRDTSYFHNKREHFSSLLNNDRIRNLKLLQIDSEKALYLPSNVNNDEEKRKEVKAISPEDSDLSEPVRASFFAAIKKGELTEVKKYLGEAHDQETLNDFLLAGDNDHKTALHLAAEQGNVDLVDYLIRQGGYPNVQDKKQRTPLYYGVENQNPEIVLSLLKNHALIDKQDTEGMSALHHAAKAGQIAIVQLLTDHGANLKLETKNKSTALILQQNIIMPPSYVL